MSQRSSISLQIFRRCLHLSEPNHRAGKGHECAKGRYGFLAAQGNPPETFDPVEETLDEMAFFAECPVDSLLCCPRRILLDLCGCPKLFRDEFPQIIGVIGRVRHDMTDVFKAFDQPTRLRAIAPLAGRDRKADWQARRIDSGMDFCGQAALRSADCVSLSPPFAPLASAWALPMVASTRIYSKSGSALNVLKRLSQTPDSVQRRNRQCAVRQLPGSGGRSRQGEAVRASHRTASTKSRVSVPVRPRSPFLPGTSGSIRAHCVSLEVRLLKIASVFDLESEFNARGNPSNEDAA
jgi:hypothetical protein